MEVLTFLVDKVYGTGIESPLALLTVKFRDGAEGALLLTEEQLQRIAMNVANGTKLGALARLESLEHTGGKQRANEFLRERARLIQGEFEFPGSLASDIRPVIHGGSLVLPAATTSAKLFFAVFDPFSAEALVVAADDCFGQ